jgi:hypothetical protein
LRREVTQLLDDVDLGLWLQLGDQCRRTTIDEVVGELLARARDPIGDLLLNGIGILAERAVEPELECTNLLASKVVQCSGKFADGIDHRCRGHCQRCARGRTHRNGSRKRFGESMRSVRCVPARRIPRLD